MKLMNISKFAAAVALIAALQVPVAVTTSGVALADGERRSVGKVYGRRGAQVRSFNRSVGGYSYRAQDT
ncbi:MAG: hypothetical protein AAFR23_05900, partial [Pseudomonadota bacterium]